ncbi:unnamed protein product [Closterium sp. Naga37s-1]|nr:unnamed protein product [Closterium sp. Naga37s-1]
MESIAHIPVRVVAHSHRPPPLGYPHRLRAVLPCPQPPRALRVTHGCFRSVASSVARAAPSPPPPDVTSSAGLRERGDSAGGGRRWLKQGGERGGAGGNVRRRRGGERGRVVLKRGCTWEGKRGWAQRGMGSGGGADSRAVLAPVAAQSAQAAKGAAAAISAHPSQQACPPTLSCSHPPPSQPSTLPRSHPPTLPPLTTPPARGSASMHRLAPLCSYHLCPPSAVRPACSSLPLSFVFLPHRCGLHCMHAWHPQSGQDCLLALLGMDMEFPPTLSLSQKSLDSMPAYQSGGDWEIEEWWEGRTRGGWVVHRAEGDTGVAYGAGSDVFSLIVGRGGQGCVHGVVPYHGGPLDDDASTLTLRPRSRTTPSTTLSRPDIEAQKSY